MKKKEFTQNAIKNGYTGNRCEGWDWIKKNLKELDYIFQTKEYKECNGRKYKCMPLLIGNDELTDIEEDVLATAWYLNNEKEHKIKKEKKIKELNAKGFYNIESDEKYHGKKIEFIIDNSDEMFGRINKYEGKLYWSSTDKALMAMRKRHTRTGKWVDKNVYVKFLT
jgi:hypothetical protein